MASVNIKRKKKKYKSGIWLTEAQIALSWGVILALLAVLGAVYLYQASRTAGSGRRVQNLQRELEEVKHANSVLERDIAEAQSLDRLQAEAARMGFVKAPIEAIEYVTIPDIASTTTSSGLADGEVPGGGNEDSDRGNRAVLWLEN